MDRDAQILNIWRERNATTPLISLKDIDASFDNCKVLKGISLNVYKGEAIAIIGPSRSGKSTLIRSINALNKIDTGSIIVDGQEINSRKLDKIELRRKVGMVFQRTSLYPDKTALENIMMLTLKAHYQNEKRAKKAANILIKKVRLQGQEDKFPSELLDEQQKRVAIARCLAMQPDVILFDDVTADLDAKGTEKIFNTIKDITKDGISCVLVTDELEHVREVANHIYFIDQGLIVEHGSPNNILENAQDPRTQNFLNQFSYQLKNTKPTSFLRSPSAF